MPISHLSLLLWSEITVDGRGNVYVSTINFDFTEFNKVLRSEHPARFPSSRRTARPARWRTSSLPDRHGHHTGQQVIHPGRALCRPDRRTLFMIAADWRSTEAVENVIKARTGQVLIIDSAATGVGWP
jgi:hypothetical protein